MIVALFILRVASLGSCLVLYECATPDITSTLVNCIIPSTPDFPTEYQIRRNSNPAGLPVFAAILVPGFRPSTIILTHMFKQIQLIRITLMSMFKVHPGSPNEVPVRLQLICTRRRRKRSDTGDCGIVYSARGFSWLLPRIV